MSFSSTPDRQLVRILESVGRDYDAACSIARQLQGQEASSSPALETANLLHDILNRVPASAQVLAEVRRQWERSGRPGGHEVQQIVSRQSAQLEYLLSVVGDSLQRLQAARDRLRPEVDLSLRNESAHRAYARGAG